MAIPRKLKLLRIEDEIFERESDLVQAFPVDVTQIESWLDFCRDLRTGKYSEFELLTVDFNFQFDRSSPRFRSREEEWEGNVDPDIASDELLGSLAWSSGLASKNSGIVIGA